MLPDLKTEFKATITKLAEHWHETDDMQTSNAESPEPRAKYK